MSTKLMNVALADVEPIEGLNPRQDTSAGIDELAKSIERTGVLQPVLVGSKNGSKKWPLIAGGRRLAAAKKAGLKTIPALVAENLAGAELEAAITENVQRQDLSPVEEARAIDKLQSERGFTQVQAAEALGKSERWVRERLRLLSLPEKAQAGYDAGVVPLDTLGPVESVAKVCPPVAEALVVEASKGNFEAELLRAPHIADTLGYLVENDRVPKGACLFNPGRMRGVPPAELPVSRKAQGELEKLIKTAPELDDGYGYKDRLTYIPFGDETIEAARAYGCLLELKGEDRWGREFTRAYITDPEWLADRAKVEAEQEIERRKTEAAKQKSNGKETPKAGTPEAEAEKEAAAERKREREKENRARIKAHNANLELGSLLRQKLGRPRFDLKAAKLFAELVFAHDGSALAARGVYVDENLHQEDWKRTKADEADGKDGTLKVEPAARAEALQALRDELRAAKTPQAVLGVVLRHLIAARLSDDVVTVQSKQVNTDTPGVWDSGYRHGDADATHKRIAALIDSIAVEAGVLPDSMRKAVEKRAAKGDA